MEPYASVRDVADRWRPLTEAELVLAETLLVDASFRVKRRFPTIDARITAGDVDPVEVAAVVAGMVKRAMMTPEGVVQHTQTGGPFSDSRQFANPMGNLYFTADDVTVLSADGDGSRVRSVRLTSAATSD